MKNITTGIRQGLIKRQEALERFESRKKAFGIEREQIKNEIEQARTIWIKTLEQMPRREFDR